MACTHDIAQETDQDSARIEDIDGAVVEWSRAPSVEYLAGVERITAKI